MKELKELEELTSWDFPNTISVPDGYDLADEPDLTRANFNVLVNEHNKMVERVNELMKVMTFKPEVL